MQMLRISQEVPDLSLLPPCSLCHCPPALSPASVLSALVALLSTYAGPCGQHPDISSMTVTMSVTCMQHTSLWDKACLLHIASDECSPPSGKYAKNHAHIIGGRPTGRPCRRPPSGC